MGPPASWYSAGFEQYEAIQPATPVFMKSDRFNALIKEATVRAPPADTGARTSTHPHERLTEMWQETQMWAEVKYESLQEKSEYELCYSKGVTLHKNGSLTVDIYQKLDDTFLLASNIPLGARSRAMTKHHPYMWTRAFTHGGDNPERHEGLFEGGFCLLVPYSAPEGAVDPKSYANQASWSAALPVTLKRVVRLRE